MSPARMNIFPESRRAERVVRFGAIVLMLVPVTLIAQAVGDNAKIRAEVQTVGDARVSIVSKDSLFDPAHHPAVYWHDPEWTIDLVLPVGAKTGYSLRLCASGGTPRFVELPEDFEQVQAIYRSGDGKVIVVEANHRSSGAFAIIDLEKGRLLDKVGVNFLKISPNRRFIFFENWSPAIGEASENLYRLYDVQRSPRENLCGFRLNDPKHEDLDDGMRGFQVFPRRPNVVTCDEKEDTDDDNMATNFVWSADSSKLVFADIKGGRMSLVLVEMPGNLGLLPRTLVYPLQGSEDVCHGAADAVGEPLCDYHLIESIGWDGDAVVASIRHPHGSSFSSKLRVPIARFDSIGK